MSSESGGPRRRAGISGIVVLFALALPFSVQWSSTDPASGRKGSEEQTAPSPPSELSDVRLEVAFADPVAEMPVAEPDPAPPAAPEPPAGPTSAADQCGDTLTWVAEAGLPLPPGVGYRCPSNQFPHQGAACWNGAPCRGSGFIAVNMDLLAGTSTDYLRHVVAHEVCHILDFQATGTTTESGADACAAAHGAG